MTEQKTGPTTGILSDAGIRTLHDEDAVLTGKPFDDDQIQPASLDLRLGKTVYRVRTSFLPGPARTVSDMLETLSLHRMSLEEGAVLETGCVYIVPLQESFRLPPEISATANPKSSTGRLDVFTRVIADGARVFDTVPPGYSGPLYLEISPRTFPVMVREGSRLSQIRFRNGQSLIADSDLKRIHARENIVSDADAQFMGGVAVSVDLSGDHGGLFGYRAKRHTAVIDMDRKAACAVEDYWEPVTARKGGLILDPNEFYILVSREAVHVPPLYAAEMVPIDPLVGEFRVHYAGFFDPGFGHDAAGGSGARAVLEVRSHEVPFLLEHGQIVGRLVYEHMTEPPATLYGQVATSNYQGQALKLSKHFIS